jgi:hypothetical protein
MGPSAAAFALAALTFLALLGLSKFEPLFASPWVLPVIPVLLGAEIGLQNAGYSAVKRALPLILTLATSSHQAEAIRGRIRSMFASPFQTGLSLAMVFVTVAVLAVLRMTGRLPGPFQQAPLWSFAIGSGLLVVGSYFGGWGVWLVVSMVRFVHLLQCQEGLALNPLAPNTTVGLHKILSLAGSFALYFSVGVTLICLPILALPWQGSRDLAFIALVYTPPAALIVLTISLLFYPFLAVRKIIRRDKETRLLSLEERLRALSVTPLSDIGQLVAYADLHRRLLESRDSVVGTSWLARLLSTLALQMPFVIQWLEKAGVDVRGTTVAAFALLRHWYGAN